MKLIDSTNACTVDVYMKCRFGKDFSGLIIEGPATPEELQVAFGRINDEFIDQSGIVDSAEFDLSNSIFYLDNRVKMIELLIYIQEESIKKIKMPCIGAFPRFKRWGHNLKWNNDIPDFWNQLKTVKQKEIKYQEELDRLLDQLLTIRKDQESLPEFKERENFIRMLNGIQKEFFRIDRTTTTMEEVAIMYNDLRQAIQNNRTPNGKHN